MNNKIGVLAIVSANLLLSIGLIAVRLIGGGSREGLFLFAVANVAASSLLFFPRVTGRPLVPRGQPQVFSILLWVACYCTNYALFVFFPRLISLPDLIIAQCVGPAAAVVLSGDWFRIRDKYRQLFSSMMSLLLLVALAIVIDLDKPSGPSIGSKWVYFAVMVLCSIGTNTAARILARENLKLMGQSRVALLNGFGMMILVAVAPGSSLTAGSLAALLPWGVAFASLVIGIQGGILFGISRTTPFLGALSLSTSVPISLLVNSLVSGTRPSGLAMALALGYCASIWINQKWVFARNYAKLAPVGSGVARS